MRLPQIDYLRFRCKGNKKISKFIGYRQLYPKSFFNVCRSPVVRRCYRCWADIVRHFRFHTAAA
ncbi:hypothetical protein HMPREF3226_02808 [Prevotella corporis]|uniref:Uncharacterized protein n=1 Tax=Prevotella corporis TaxID=28128 RepID=A0A133PT18_9BACT|nr:hypothetical protein HMPREF3226_02808 [Prevotella corporis]